MQYGHQVGASPTLQKAGVSEGRCEFGKQINKQKKSVSFVSQQLISSLLRFNC